MGKEVARIPEKVRLRKDEESLAWYVFLCLAIVIVIIYYMVIFFTLCDE